MYTSYSSSYTTYAPSLHSQNTKFILIYCHYVIFFYILNIRQMLSKFTYGFFYINSYARFFVHVGTWRGIFEPSVRYVSNKRKRSCVDLYKRNHFASYKSICLHLKFKKQSLLTAPLSFVFSISLPEMLVSAF